MHSVSVLSSAQTNITVILSESSDNSSESEPNSRFNRSPNGQVKLRVTLLVESNGMLCR